MTEPLQILRLYKSNQGLELTPSYIVNLPKISILKKQFMKKHWLTNTHWIEIVKKSGPVEELNPGPLDLWSRALPLRKKKDHSGPKGSLD